MGIRYYAYPVEATAITAAKEDPWLYVGEDPLMDAWSLPEDQPVMLYLDKCWTDLQRILGPSDSAAARESFSLVQGTVRWTDDGEFPVVEVLDPEQVAAISRDLAQVRPADVEATMRKFGPRFGDPIESEIDVVLHFLSKAQTFLTQMTAEGNGLVYLIG